jgi:hypothetical protein
MRVFDQVDYPPLRYIRQQMSNPISHLLPLREYNPWEHRTRLPELDQEAIKVQPPPTS